MIRKTILSLVITFLMCIYASADIMRDVSEAACRVIAGNNCGSGTAVFEDENNVYVLTNAHVVENYRQATVEFWKYGRKVPKPIPGNIVWRKHNYNIGIDFAIIQVPKTNFVSNVLPNIIHFLPTGINIDTPGTYVTTAGCPRSQWLSVKEGYLVKRSNYELIFRPVAEDGQSGSGLFTHINGNTYIVGVVTARNASRIIRDTNGFDITLGIALDIHRMRDALQNNVKFKGLVKTKVAPRHFTNVVQAMGKLYAKGTNGKYYLQNPDGSVNVPPGIKISQWNCPGPNCPSTTQPPPRQPQMPGNLVPLPGPVLPSPNNGGGYGTIPPGFGDEQQIPVPEEDELPEEEINPLQIELDAALTEKTKLQIQLAEKEEQAAQLIIQIDELKAQIEELQNKNTELNNQLEEKTILIVSLETNITKIDQQLTEIQKNVTQLNIQIEQKDTKIQEYQNALDNIINNSTPTENNKVSWWSKVWHKAQTLHPLWLILCGVGGVLLFSKWRTLATIPSIIWRGFSNILQPKQDNNTNIHSGMSDKEILEWLKKQFSHTEAKIDAVGQYSSTKFNELNSKLESKIDNRDDIEINTNVNIEKDDSDGHGGLDWNSLTHCKPKSECMDRIKQFFELKQHDGESVEQWALYALLYKEAMELLRRGSFSLNIAGEKITLQGQRITAEKIDEWVRGEYIKRMSVKKLCLDTIYHEALLGFLYKEAVRLLRTGAFPVLGAQETANAIEHWVQREFLQRMGVTF